MYKQFDHVCGETVCICLQEGEFNFNMHKQFDHVCGETVCICLREGELNLNMHKQFHHICGQTVCNCLKQCYCLVFGSIWLQSQNNECQLPIHVFLLLNQDDCMLTNI